MKKKPKGSKKSGKRSARTEEVDETAESESPEEEQEEGSGEDGESPPPSGKRGRPSSIPYDKFVRAWSTAATVKDAADQLGIHSNSASAIANRLRKQGVALKKFSRRNAQPIDVKELNKIAKSAE